MLSLKIKFILEISNNIKAKKNILLAVKFL